MLSESMQKEPVLVLVDPVSCGAPALERTLQELSPERHELTIVVVAKSAPGGGGDEAYAADFAYADNALAVYQRTAREAGFHVRGWVTPDRRRQIIRELEASGSYGRALAVSPSGPWRRLMKRDVTALLERMGVETSLHCTP